MDLRRLDLNLLVSLDVLLEERNVTRAARRLRLSQPAVSAQLSRLRRLLDDPLLIPASSGRGMTATARALELIEPLHGVLRDLEAVIGRRGHFDPAKDSRDFQIATTDNGLVVVGLPLLELVRHSAGNGIRVAFRLAATDVARQIERREVDLLILPPGMLPAALKTRRLYREAYAMAQRRGHPRGTARLTLEDYCALDHVLVSLDGGGFQGRVDQALAKRGQRRSVRLSLPNFTSVLPVLRATDYVCTMPARFVATLRDEFETFELPLAVPGFEMHMAWHPRDHFDPGHVWLRSMIIEAMSARDAASEVGYPTSYRQEPAET